MTGGPQVIGMIGGMSWESSAQYYRLANEMVQERLGGLHSARIVLTSVDFADIEALQASGQWEEAGQLLVAAAQGLEAAGAQLLLICTNTMHKVADQVQAAVKIPLLHLGDVTAQQSPGPGWSGSGCWVLLSRWSRLSTAIGSPVTVYASWSHHRRTGMKCTASSTRNCA